LTTQKNSPRKKWFCSGNDIILQSAVAYNHTIHCRVEVAIGCSKQHGQVALVCANAPTRFWSEGTVDFTCKKNTLWAKRDEYGELSTANDRMQPAFQAHTKLLQYLLVLV